MTVQAIVLHLHNHSNLDSIKQLIGRLDGEAVQVFPTVWLVKNDIQSPEITFAIRPLLNEGEEALVMGVSPKSVFSMAPQLPPAVHEWLVKNF